ncbi:hypothetical protein ACFORO_12615 [Amycolatopsis halotolerans]|uniref:Uncharacterized protein n=1 Tax=Amycolatopsis halotolerans TaxID=330083 RepID=A0ABV7QGC8_9PSEU
MPRIMYDSITAADIPATVPLVAGYCDLSSAWSAADWARFPNATKVRIARSARTNDGHVLDVERFLATPDQAPGWVAMRRAAGCDPTVYCNESALATVQAAFDAAQVPQPHYWVARYDNIPSVPAEAVAKQYINDPASGGHYDLSAVADYWPGIDPAPVTTHQEDEMAFGRVCPAGTNEHADMSVVGCSKLRIHDSFGHTVHVKDILFYGDSGADPNGTGVGGGYAAKNSADHWDWVSNRPGPIAVPAGATTVTVLYDADHDFYLSASAA